MNDKVKVSGYFRTLNNKALKKKSIKYPTVREMIEANKRAIALTRQTKAERAKLLTSDNVLKIILSSAKASKGDIFTKAAIFLTEINRSHPFESANKRTAYLVATEFILSNKGFMPKKKKEEFEFLIEIREGKVSFEDSVRWLKYGRR